eukprot:scaffold2352_cov153-Ochromonas_danica.AAC.6
MRQGAPIDSSASEAEQEVFVAEVERGDGVLHLLHRHTECLHGHTRDARHRRQIEDFATINEGRSLAFAFLRGRGAGHAIVRLVLVLLLLLLLPSRTARRHLAIAILPNKHCAIVGQRQIRIGHGEVFGCEGQVACLQHDANRVAQLHGVDFLQSRPRGQALAGLRRLPSVVVGTGGGVVLVLLAAPLGSQQRGRRSHFAHDNRADVSTRCEQQDVGQRLHLHLSRGSVPEEEVRLSLEDVGVGVDQGLSEEGVEVGMAHVGEIDEAVHCEGEAQISRTFPGNSAHSFARNLETAQELAAARVELDDIAQALVLRRGLALSTRSHSHDCEIAPCSGPDSEVEAVQL